MHTRSARAAMLMAATGLLAMDAGVPRHTPQQRPSRTTELDIRRKHKAEQKRRRKAQRRQRESVR